MGFDAVERMKVVHNVLKYLLTIPVDPIWTEWKDLVRHRQQIAWSGFRLGDMHLMMLFQLVPLSMLKLVMSVEVSSSSDDKPSLCSALFPFCSLACRRRVLHPQVQRRTMKTKRSVCDKQQQAWHHIDSLKSQTSSSTGWQTCALQSD